MNLANEISARGIDVDLVLANATGGLVSEVGPGINVVDLASPNVRHSVKPLYAYLRARRPDALLSLIHHANVAAFWAHRFAHSKAHLVLSERANLSQTLIEYGPVRSWLTKRLAKTAYRHADVVLCVSQGVADDLGRLGFSASRLVVAYNPTIRPDIRERALVPPDHPWFLPGEPPVVVAVGRLEPQKDYPTLLRAFALVASQREARLLIIGRGALLRSLERLRQRLGLDGAVSFLGLTENPHPFIARAAVYVLASKYEGLPNALIEAVAHGVPVVSTDCESGPTEILRGGEFGALVPVGDWPALAKAILGALDGHVPAPPPEAWEPFTVATATTRYLELLFPDRGRDDVSWTRAKPGT